jgi:hypothetical protein
VPLKWRVVEGGAVAAPPHPTTAPDTHDRHLSYIHNVDLPPVAIIDRSPIGTGHKIVFGVIAVLGAVAWAMIAFVRGETVNAVWFVVAAICTYAIGYRVYARLIEAKIVHPRDDHVTPAEILDDGTDYVPTDRRVLGTTPKLLEKESQMRLIGYGGMLTESFVAVMALISASILDQHLYFTLNAPVARQKIFSSDPNVATGRNISNTPPPKLPARRLSVWRRHLTSWPT